MDFNIATDDDIEKYTQGECHVFALAVWNKHPDASYFEIVEINDDAFGEGINSVLHVYCVVSVDGEEMAVDITGMRPVSEVTKHCEELFEGEVMQRDMLCESRFSIADLVDWYVDMEGDGSKPLAKYSDRDVADAERIVETMIANYTPAPSVKM